jgi:hypothetical protein
MDTVRIAAEANGGVRTPIDEPWEDFTGASEAIQTAVGAALREAGKGLGLVIKPPFSSDGEKASDPTPQRAV